MKSEQRKELAKLLYTKEHLLQKEIAERVGVTPQTVNRWVKRESWDKLRVSITITKEEQIKNLYNQLSEMFQFTHPAHPFQARGFNSRTCEGCDKACRSYS